jgi:hypothetical protein
MEDAMSRYALLATAALALLAGGEAQAQEVVELMPAYLVRRIEQDQFTTATQGLLKKGLVSQGVLAGAKQWTAGQPIQVCFFGGTVGLRNQIATLASTWTLAGAPIKLDFGDINNPRLCGSGFAHIRVGFDQPGYWSFVGQDSIVYAAQTEQSLNFARFNLVPPAPAEFRRVVLHEFGHALGFQHEHQHPTNICETEFNWPAVYKYLAGSPNYWDEETIKHNMRAVPYHAGDVTIDFDRKSIMLYSFPSSFYLQGKKSACYSDWNDDLSDGDKRTLQLAYGMIAGGQTPAAAVAALASASGKLSVAEQQVIGDRVLLLNAPNSAKAAIADQREMQFRTPDFGAAVRSLNSSPAAALAVRQ